MRGTMDIVNPVGGMTKLAGNVGKGAATGDWSDVKQQFKDDLAAGTLLGGVAATVATGGAAAPAALGVEGAVVGGEAVAGGALAAEGTAAAAGGEMGLGQIAGQLGKGVAKQVGKSYAKDAAQNLLGGGNGHTSGPGYASGGAPQNTMGGAVQPQGPSFQDVAHGAGGIIGSAVNAAQPQTSGWDANDGS